MRVLRKLPEFIETWSINFKILSKFRCDCYPNIRIFTDAFISLAEADDMTLSIRS